jgi:manganese/zinc/iron transport system substrate-binding protein
MNDVLQKMSRTKPVLGIGEFIPENRLQRAGDGSPTIDPHLWMDSNIWLMGIAGIADTLQQLFPNDTAYIGNNYRNYRDTLEKVGLEVEQFIASIPSDRRVLITSHDAFRYFGLATHMEVKGLQGISTVSEYGLQDVSNMVNFITERKIKAVFVESSVSQKSLQAVLEGCASKGHPIRIGGTLYSDSMGKKGTPEGSYKGMLRHNAQTIANALR